MGGAELPVIELRPRGIEKPNIRISGRPAQPEELKDFVGREVIVKCYQLWPEEDEEGEKLVEKLVFARRGCLLAVEYPPSPYSQSPPFWLYLAAPARLYVIEYDVDPEVVANFMLPPGLRRRLPPITPSHLAEAVARAALVRLIADTSPVVIPDFADIDDIDALCEGYAPLSALVVDVLQEAGVVPRRPGDEAILPVIFAALARLGVQLEKIAEQVKEDALKYIRQRALQLLRERGVTQERLREALDEMFDLLAKEPRSA